MKKKTKKQDPPKRQAPFLNKKQLERRKFIVSVRLLVKKARKGDLAAAEILQRECEQNEDYRQIVKRIVDSLDIQQQKANFAKVNYKEESRAPQHWPLKS
jgi:hypothetical protein